jgi:aspartyl-tRNA(Asn)/glutamyl-tRNA(Gln) amidotransferase subunit B
VSNYTPTIGIECHVQLKTKTKLFAAVGNDAREASPNSLVSHICFGLPGALPVLNKKAVELAIRAAYALQTTPAKFSKFDRKHYFYPDLPKGYQISQFNHPIINGGKVDITVDGQKKTVGVTRAHLEEDAGKNVHPTGKDYSLVDLNRAGTPLLEIVSEPDIHSAAEARAYARELYLLMKYADVSEANLFYGNMRFDVNVSVSKSTTKLGIRTETKNLNSFKAVEKAVEYEIKRQTEELEKGNEIIQETRGWDDAKQKTVPQRGKEEAHDYRYFPDPDIPPIVLEDQLIKSVGKGIPTMPGEWREKFHQLKFDDASVETLIEAEVENDDVHYLSLIENSLNDQDLARFLVNFFVNIEIPYRREDKSKIYLGHEDCNKALLEIYKLQKDGKLSSTKAKELFATLLSEKYLPNDIEIYSQEHGFSQVSDEGELEKIVAGVIDQNKKAAEDVKNGEMKAIGFLVGQVMKASKGQANPGLAQELIKKQLGI